ncbi:MAG: hypothetical protein ACF8PN_03145 [Phycisphaerales bacterium]
MILDPVELRHVTLWSRSPALELSMLLEAPAPAGRALRDAAAQAIGLRGFWERPRNLRGEPNTDALADADDYPVVALIPQAGSGGLVGVNVLSIDRTERGDGESELLFLSPYDIAIQCWGIEMIGSPPEKIGPAILEVAAWAWRLREYFPIGRAWAGYESLFVGWDHESIGPEPGVWMTGAYLEGLEIPVEEEVMGCVRVGWASLAEAVRRHGIRVES